MMKHRHPGGGRRHFSDLDHDDPFGERHVCGRGPGHRGRHGHHGHGFRGRRRGGRLFDYGELKLLVLSLIAAEPRHGYELIKVIEERFGGAYTPSPGVIYPTLAWLDDMGYAQVQAEEGGRKRYHVTAEGEAYLEANRADVDALLARAPEGDERPGFPPAPIVRAMENLKTALRLRLRQGPVDAADAAAIADAIDAAAKAVERRE